MFLFYVLTALVIYFVAYPEDTPQMLAKRLPRRFPWYLYYPVKLLAWMSLGLAEVMWWTCLLVYKTTKLLFKILTGSALRFDLPKQSHRRVRVNAVSYKSRRRSGRPVRKIDFA